MKRTIYNSASSDGVLRIDVYEDVGEDPWTGEGVRAQDVLVAAREFSGSVIEVRINSFGGNAFDGIAIYNVLRDKSRRGCHVDVSVDGIAASAASLIACAGDTIRMASNAILMIHMAESFAAGNQGEMERMTEALSKVDVQIAATYAETAKRLGKETSADEFMELMKAESWLTAEEAMRLGLATTVGEPNAIAANARRALLMAGLSSEQSPRAQSPRPQSEGAAPMPDRLLKALGATDMDEALAIAARVPGVLQAAEAATNTAAELHELTGKQGPQALAVVQAWRAGFDALPSVTAERDALQAQIDAAAKEAAEQEARNAVSAKIESMFAAGKLTVAMRAWAEAQSLEVLNAYEAVAPVVVPGAGASARPTEPENGGESKLTDEDRKVIARMGISVADFIAAKSQLQDSSTSDE